MYDAHLVSVKIAIYARDTDAVLVMAYGNNPLQPKAYGLPGGHIDGDEEPDEALERELEEELALTLDKYEHRDFFRKNTARDIVLAYRAIVSSDVAINPPHPEVEHGVWMTRSEIETIKGISPVYKTFIINNWPTQL